MDGENKKPGDNALPATTSASRPGSSPGNWMAGSAQRRPPHLLTTGFEMKMVDNGGNFLEMPQGPWRGVPGGGLRHLAESTPLSSPLGNGAVIMLDYENDPYRPMEMNAFPTPAPNLDEELLRQATANTHAIAAVLKRLEKAPADATLRLEHERLLKEGARIQGLLKEQEERAVAILKSEFGFDQEDLERFEHSRYPKAGNEYWNAEIQQFPSTPNLDELVAEGYDRLIRLVDQDWLRSQSHLSYGQSYDDPPKCRLHLVGRQRLLPFDAPARPQRFAQMLLMSHDQIQGRHNLDFFDGPMLISETAHLGNSLREIDELGDEAKKKLKSLPKIADRDVASTVYELLVGAACVRFGRKIEMLPASSTKTPDFRVLDQGAPFVIECKRRLGLNEYAMKEARHVERLYAAAAHLFDRNHLHVEVEFSTTVSTVSEKEFTAEISLLCESKDCEPMKSTQWGTLRLRRMPPARICPVTLAFSPSFLLDIFGWKHVESEWDGLICQIDPVESPLVAAAIAPRCLKWRCNAEESILKKSRGLNSLWADAIKQIPTGEVGGVYIAYKEGMRAGLADARTEHLLQTIKERKLFHRSLIHVPWTVITRLYPQALGNGAPELIESAIPMTESGFDYLLGEFPSRVFDLSSAK
jgi:hypothetical protein